MSLDENTVYTVHIKWVKQNVNIIKVTTVQWVYVHRAEVSKVHGKVPGSSWLVTVNKVQGRVLGGGRLVVSNSLVTKRLVDCLIVDFRLCSALQ